jgi:hypothetical protein
MQFWLLIKSLKNVASDAKTKGNNKPDQKGRLQYVIVLY